MTVRQISIADLFAAPNLDALLAEYYAESAIAGLHDQARGVNVGAYTQLEAAGLLFALGAFADGSLVGALILLVAELPHYGIPVATTESFFVSSDHRKSGAGLALLRMAERVACEAGAKGLLVSAPIHGRLAEVLERSDYQESNRVFFRSLA